MADEKKNSAYGDSGVNIDAGNEAVKMMKEHVRTTFNASIAQVS